jgi:hypothetical protein
MSISAPAERAANGDHACVRVAAGWQWRKIVATLKTVFPRTSPIGGQKWENASDTLNGHFRFTLPQW